MRPERLPSPWDLFTLSFLALFFELLVIRWIPTVIGPMAYFSNLTLILAFLGLGVGCLCARKIWSAFEVFPLSALMLASAVVILQRWRISFVDASVVFLSEPAFSEPRAAELPPISWVVVLFVLAPLIIISFICLGQEIGRRLRGFGPLVGYTINIAGSLVGVAGFAGLAWLQTPPVAWFAVMGLLALWLLRSKKRQVWLESLAVVAILVMVGRTPPNVFWSPYYRIQVTPIYDQEGPGRQFVGNAVDVNTVFHQYHLDLSGRVSDPPGAEATPFLSQNRELYNLPYQFTRPVSVLVLGAGGGNDVAAALRYGAERVDAVEIDPVIAALGRQWHPERPYANPRVRLIIDDARSFLRKAPAVYDLIVLGFLDTIRLLSEFSSVRLESYVYTRESFQDIKRHLKPDGVVALGFSTTTTWMLAKLYGLVRETFGAEPLIYTAGRSTILLIRPSGALTPVTFKHLWRVKRQSLDQLLDAGLPLPTDDWPFLYMKARSIPQQYWMVIVVILALTVGLVGSVSPLTGAPFEWPFFFLGAAFMLVETLSITRLARFLGSTWVVSSVVILLILLTILLATWCAAKWRRPSLKAVYAWLGGTLALSYFASGVSAWRLCVLVGLTIFLAGVVFATVFRQTAVPDQAFGANVLGAVVGGLFENLSLIFGLQALYLFAIGLYLLSFWTLYRKPSVS